MDNNISCSRFADGSTSILAPRPVVLDGRELCLDALTRNSPVVYMALKALRGDPEACEICKAMALRIEGTNGADWFNYKELP